MAYVSLYRRYRPLTFAEVVGQGHVTTTLAHAIDNDRLHHAYLFTGPRGTGKTSTARILAKSLNCESGPTSVPDSTCAHCRQITAGSHVDVIEIDAASHGGVDDVRDLRERVAFAPASARMKVYIVDECHMLSTAGWNAFLKTVEEPPGHVLFVFATTEPHKVLPTILSRTQRFDFKRIGATELAAHVTSVAAAEGVALESAAVDLIVRAGDGSARDTVSVLEQVIAFAGHDAPISEAAVADVLGSVPDALLGEMVTLLASGDVGGLCVLVQRLADGGGDLRQFSRDAVAHLRTLFLFQVAPDANLAEASADTLPGLRAQAETLGRVELLRAIDLLSEAQAQMRRGNTRLPLEIALAKAAMPEAAGDPAALAARLDRLERRAAGAPAEAAGSEQQPGVTAAAPATEAQAPAPVPARAEGAPRAPSPSLPADDEPTEAAPQPTQRADAPGDPPAPDATAGELGLEQVAVQWPAVLDAVKTRSRRLHAFLSPGRPAAVSRGVVTVEFGAASAFHAEQCSAEEWRELFTGVLSQIYGEPLQLHCVVGDAPAAAPPATDDRATADDAPAEVEIPETAEGQAASEAAGELHDLAIERLTTELGATVLEDRRGS